MDNLNEFFRTLYINPSLLWKVFIGILFLSLSIIILLIPKLTAGFDATTRTIFGIMLLVYALFRLGTFYVEYKRILRDE